MSTRKPKSEPINQSGTQSLERAFGLLRAIAKERDGVRLSDLASSQGLNTPTARRILLALIREGFVEQDLDTRRYLIGPEAFVMGQIANRRFGIQRLAEPALLRLAQQTQDTAFLSVPVASYSACVQRVEGEFPIRTHVLQAGDRHPLGVGAGSLAMLAAMSDTTMKAHIEANRPQMVGRYQAFTPEVLSALVRETRLRGFAVNRGLLVSDSWGVGVAVLGTGADPVGALSIAAINTRLQEDRLEEIGVLLKVQAQWVANQLRSITGDSA